VSFAILVLTEKQQGLGMNPVSTGSIPLL